MAKILDWDDHIGQRLRLRDLRVFFVVVQCGSMAKAATQLRVSQPAVSQVIVALESALAVKLLDRNTRGVEPTIYGRALLGRARAAFDELRQGIRDIQFLADPTSGELRIGCSEAFSGSILPPIIHRFSQAFPRVAVHVNDIAPLNEQSVLDDRKNDLLMGLWVKPLTLTAQANQMNVEVLFDDHLVVVAGEHSQWARRRKIDLAELIDEPWVLGPPGTWNHLGTAEAFRTKALDMPKVMLVTYSVPLRVYALGNGPYIAAFPESVVRLNVERYALKILPVGLPAAPRPAAIMTPKNRTLNPLVGRFIACARDVAKSIAGQPRSRTTSVRGPNVF
jgi:DNA-binding transcriptional LysR family regulator